MLRRWLARRFKDDETAKWTLAVFCGGGGLIAFIALLVVLGMQAVARASQ
jgi:hypothetical protein